MNMITTFTGSNYFLMKMDLKNKILEFSEKYGDLAVQRIDGEEAELSRIREALTSLPFLSSKKMVVLRAPSANKQFLEQAEALLSEVSETTDLIIIEPKIDKRSVYYKFLKKNTNFTDYIEPDSSALAAWLVKIAKEKNGSISVSDARYLVERVGQNQQLLFNDLEKLILYDARITRDSIILLIDQTPQSTIFQLLEAAFAGKSLQAHKLYQEQRAMNVEAPQIIAMLAWQLHVLAVIKAAGKRSPANIAQESKISLYVIQKSVTIARKLNMVALNQLINNLLDIDLKSKSTNLDIDEAMQNYLLKIAISS